MEPVEVSGNLGDIDHNRLMLDQASELVDRANIIVQRNIRAEINDITGETSRSIRTSRSISQMAATGEVFTTVPWAVQLEFFQAPFMRPGLWLSRPEIRRELKELFGPGYRATMRFRARRRRR